MNGDRRAWRAGGLTLGLLVIAVLVTAGTALAAGRGGFGGGHAVGRGGASFSGGGHFHGGGGGHSWGGGRGFVGGGRSWGGGRGFYGRGWYGPRHYRPHTVVRFGLGLDFGYPVYDPYWDYPYYVPAPYPVYVDHPVYVDRPVVMDGDEISNEPPDGCYYYDPYCRRRFSSLDRYLDHLKDYDHPEKIDVVRKDDDSTRGTWEYSHGRWVPEDY